MNASEGNQTYPANVTLDQEERRRFLIVYFRLVVFVLTICSVSLALNLCILCSSRWMHRNRFTPTLRFIFSLAGSDAFGSCVQIFHFTVHSLLPKIYNIKLGSKDFCFLLVVEAFRLSLLFISVLHLLALATNHYFGIVRPLHYAATVTKRTTVLILACIWISPVAFNLIYFSSIPGEGFQSLHCHRFDFISRKRFVMTYSSLYFVPLLLMTFIYGHIFLVVRRHQRGLIRVEENDGTRRKSSTVKHYIQNARRPTRRFTHDFTLENRRCSSSPQMKKSIKAVVTTLLILGSYLIGWIPAVLSYELTCSECQFPTRNMSPYTVLAITVTVNCLIVLKTCLNPIIYAVRIPEIREALLLMKRSFCFGEIRERRVTRAGTIDTNSCTRSSTTNRKSVFVSRTSRKSLESSYSRRQQENAYVMQRFELPEPNTFA